MKPFLKSLSVVIKPIDAEAYGDDEPFGVLLGNGLQYLSFK